MSPNASIEIFKFKFLEVFVELTSFIVLIKSDFWLVITNLQCVGDGFILVKTNADYEYQPMVKQN
jgi:hypothetical protein